MMDILTSGRVGGHSRQVNAVNGDGRICEDICGDKKRPGKIVLALRERKVVQFVAKGRSYRTTADVRTNLTRGETYRSAAMGKLNLSSTAAIVRHGVSNELIET
jgi:hypothetical protein